MDEILSKAKSLNEEVSKLNNERIRQEGMLESAKNSYETAIKAYEEKYGVKLTEETIQEEYNKVFAAVKGSILDLTEKIESIQRGDYKQNVETVEYDLEPDVEPVREEKKKEPSKRGRKPKAKKEETVETPVEKDDSTVESTSDEEDVKSDDGPFKFDMSFDGFGGVSTEEKVEETKPVESKKSTKGKSLSASDLSAALKATEVSNQHPVTAISEDDENEIPSGLPFGENPDLVTKKPEVKSDVEGVPEGFSFGGFGDLSNFGAETQEVKNEDNSDVDDEVDLSNFSFGGFGDIASPQESKETDSELNGFAGFGGFGGLDDSAFKTIPDTTVEEKKPTTPVEDKSSDAPVGWGDFGATDFDSLLNGVAGLKFGE